MKEFVMLACSPPESKPEDMGRIVNFMDHFTLLPISQQVAMLLLEMNKSIYVVVVGRSVGGVLSTLTGRINTII